MVELDLEKSTLEGTTVTVTLFDSAGWERDAQRWSTKYGHETREETLQAFLVRFAGLPDAEAESLADELLGVRLEEWSSRGGPQHARTIERLSLLLVIGLAAGGILAIVGVIAIVWFLIT